MLSKEDWLEGLHKSIRRVVMGRDRRDYDVVLLNPVEECKIPDIKVSCSACGLLSVRHCYGRSVVLVERCRTITGKVKLV